MSNDAARRQRAAERAGRIVRLDEGQRESAEDSSPELRISLATALSRWAHELGGEPFPTYSREQIPTAHRRLHERCRHVPVLSREALIRNKLASGRAQDLADVEALRALS